MKAFGVFIDWLEVAQIQNFFAIANIHVPQLIRPFPVWM